MVVPPEQDKEQSSKCGWDEEDEEDWNDSCFFPGVGLQQEEGGDLGAVSNEDDEGDDEDCLPPGLEPVRLPGGEEEVANDAKGVVDLEQTVQAVIGDDDKEKKILFEVVFTEEGAKEKEDEVKTQA